MINAYIFLYFHFEILLLFKDYLLFVVTKTRERTFLSIPYYVIYFSIFFGRGCRERFLFQSTDNNYMISNIF